MIAAHLEPKGLKPDAKPIADFARDAKDRAIIIGGSQQLLEAILLASGSPVESVMISRPTPEIESPKPPRVRDYILIEPAERPIARIQRIVAAFYGIPLIEMRSHRRSFEVAHPRQLAMYFAKELTPMSLPAIGREFGGRDHTTVICALRAVERRMAKPSFSEEVDVLREMLA